MILLAANQGDASAQYNLGNLYLNGEGLPQDYKEAARWYRLAADQGMAIAQNNLGTLYLNGEGLPQDYVMAHMWFNLSAAMGYGKAMKNRDIVAGRMTLADISKAQSLASKWMAEHTN